MTDDPQNFLLSSAARISAAVIDRLGKKNVVSAFLSGSVARGEVAAFRGPSGTEIYSDLDLFFVVGNGIDLDRARAAAREAAAGAAAGSEGYVWFAEPDVGVFSFDDFLGQKTRPGTVEIAGSHVVLHGSAEIPEMARRFDASAIDRAEALYLVENRLLELCALADRLEDDRSGGFGRYARYALLKAGSDAGSSVLIVLGRFHPSRAERMRRLGDAVSSGECLRLLPEDDFAILVSRHGELADLQSALERRPAADRAEFDGTARVLLENWRRATGYISGLTTEDWNTLFEWRCKAGRWVSNARELRIFARRRGVPRLRVLRGVGRVTRLSPVDALRVSGAARLLGRLGIGGDPVPSGDGTRRGRYVDFLDELTLTFGYETGDVFERARRMFEDTR